MPKMLDRKMMGAIMDRVCPSDATQDSETKRLLANIDRLTASKAETGEKVNREAH